MVIFINYTKIKRYIFIIFLLLILCIVFLFSYKNILTTNVFISNNKDLELQSQIQKIFDIRNDAIIKEDIDILDTIYSRDSNTGKWAYEYEVNRLKYLNQWMNKQSAKLIRIDSKVFLRTFNEQGDGYSVNLAVTTEYEYLYRDSTTSDLFSVSTYNSLDLIPNKDSWKIAMEWYMDPFVNTLDLDQLNLEKIKEIILAGEKKDISDLNERRIGSVNYAIEYSGVARPPDYSFQYNNEYKNYNHQGGNCTNYASQVLHEGGKFSKTGAWNYNGGDGSRAWVNASAFNSYMLYSGRGSLISSGSYEQVLKDSYKLLPGDYIAYEKKGKVAHICIVTGSDSKGYTLINANNPDCNKIPWDLGWSGSGIKFWLVRVNY